MRPLNPIEWNAVAGVQSDLFQWMSEQARLSFSERSQLRRVRPGQLVFQHGERRAEMYRVVRGVLRISSMRSDGNQMIYGLVGPGECLAASSLIDEGPMPQTAETLDEVQLQVLAAPSFKALREEHREFDEALLRLLCRRIRLFSATMADNALADVPQRVALRLMEVSRVGPRGSLSVSITQEALGLLAGVSRQTINKVLRQFEQDGLLSARYGSIELSDVDALKRIADFRN